MSTLTAKREVLALVREKLRREEIRASLPRDWEPRPYQQNLWNYLQAGGRRAVEIAHRRWGKDDVCLHWTCRAAHYRIGTFWHLLPLASQARKAIWDAVNPHTGRRRIDEAFPKELRASTRETDMMIRFNNGSTWQVVGSDNFDHLVGAPPIGLVMSEWALANPRAWSYLRPILDENGGWALFISTPRGRNHLHRLFELAQNEAGWYAETSPATETDVFTPEDLARILREYQAEWGDDDGQALFDQEFHVSFDAPLVGAYYAKLIAKAESEGRVSDNVPVEPGVPVQTAWDLGYTDDTAIWWFQVLGRELRILDHYSQSGEDIEHYAKVIKERGYWYGPPGKEQHWVPWDARPKTLASGGKSILEQGWTNGVRMRVAPNLAVQDGIQAVRQVLPRCVFHKTKCAKGIESLRNYQREWDDERKVFKKTPLHNYASHDSDAMRILAVAWRARALPQKEEDKPTPGLAGVTMDDLWKDDARRRSQL